MGFTCGNCQFNLVREGFILQLLNMGKNIDCVLNEVAQTKAERKGKDYNAKTHARKKGSVAELSTGLEPDKNEYKDASSLLELFMDDINQYKNFGFGYIKKDNINYAYLLGNDKETADTSSCIASAYRCAGDKCKATNDCELDGQ